MKKIKKLFVVLAAGMALMLPVQAMAAVDLNAKYEISTNQIQGWPAGPEIISDTGILMDADTGVVLYNKGADEQRYPASITKIMTLLVAVENSTMDEQVTFTETGVRNVNADSSNIGTQVGEILSMKDCLYALIIQSANDVAAQIAEHIGGSVEGFAEKMNEKAKELGCKDTHFVTPNGLDGEDEGGIHHTTARDLALIMAYAIKNATFVHITQTRDYTFTDISGKKHYSVHNTNAFLDMETGVISGKTGFTGNAGYCYVCAVRQDERLFIVALLGCGWPGNKNYKWSDTKKLLSYGRENYQYMMLPELPQLPEIPVTEAAPGKEDPYPQKSDRSGYPPKQVMLKIHAVLSEKDREKRYLLKKTETITWETELPDKLPAPIQKNQKIGTLHAKLNGKELLSCLVTADDKIDRITYKWYVDKVFKDYFH